MKHFLFYLNMALYVIALKIGLAFCLLGYLPPLPFMVWGIVTLFIDVVWYALTQDVKPKVRYDD